MFDFKILLTSATLTFILFTGGITFEGGDSAYGIAGSLEKLQEETNNETKYQNELIGYMKSHNITGQNDVDIGLIGKIVSIPELEEMVKTHMEWCQGKPAGEIGGDPFYTWWGSNGDC